MKKLFFILFCFASLLGAEEETEELTPWFTGPLIAPRGTAIPYGDFELDTYIYASSFTGNYNSNWNEESSPLFFSFNPQLLTFTGLTSWIDIQIVPQYFYQVSQGKHSSGFGDLLVGFDFQLYSDEEKGWFPGVKFNVSALFPTGKFQRLNPDLHLTDLRGGGSFVSSMNLVLYKAYHLYDEHFLSMTISGAYAIPSSAHVHDFNAYGGGFGTRGRVTVGNTFTGILSFEYSLTRNWALALDSVWSQTERSTFKGDLGVDAFGEEASVGFPSSENLSFTPAIEYNFSENSGIIAGCWFSAMGRNSQVFRNAVMNLYLYF